MQEFLNPKSMLTPGVAGALVTMLTASLSKSFNLPGSWTALVLSFLLGIILLLNQTVAMPQRLILFILNSLVIFSVAVGGNSVGAKLSNTPKGSFFNEAQMEKPFFHDWF